MLISFSYLTITSVIIPIIIFQNLTVIANRCKIMYGMHIYCICS